MFSVQRSLKFLRSRHNEKINNNGWNVHIIYMLVFMSLYTGDDMTYRVVLERRWPDIYDMCARSYEIRFCLVCD